ncbi:PhpK family radical SAM P-methyltransferase [Streptomyces mirabilis]|uniref:PhpK family radical SAM P-methyltransferase n=1 Tax=Streptomyces mirabilis TaxID=68239 RepID=UPI0033B63970
MVDCIIVGHNDGDFQAQVDMVAGMGRDSGAYRDLSLAFMQWQGEPTRALDFLTRQQVKDSYGDDRRYHNLEMLWPTITYLGSFLARHGYSFDYVNLFQEEKEQFAAKLADEPLAVAVTTTLYVTPDPAVEVVQFVREHSAKTKVIVGGPFVANYARQTSRSAFSQVLNLVGADVYVVSSEGESTMANVLAALKAGKSLRGIPNVIFREDGEWVFNEEKIESNALDQNMVDYSLFEGSLGQFVTLRTAKSCPFSCAFCGFPARAGKYVYQPIELVERELDRIREHGSVTSLTIIDDTVNVPKVRFKEILRMMIRKNYGFHWNSFYRSDHGDDETIDLMAEAGCEGVFLGVESGSDTMLKGMNKTARRHNYMRAIPRLRQVGIVTHANLIIGFPGETKETVDETRSLLSEAQPDFFRPQLWYADPITPIWERRDEFDVSGSMFNWRHRTMNSDQAADIIDDMFLNTTGSLWLPQSGFELWSVFYLMRRGMSLDQVKNYVRTFNAAVGENVGRSAPAEVSAAAVDRLLESARFKPAGVGGAPLSGAVSV